MKFDKDNKAQVTLFVILGLIMVSAIILLVIILFNLQKKETDFLNPKQYIETCLKEELPRPINPIFKGGGFVNPEKFVLYNGEKFNYLCYTPNIGVRCNIIYPQLRIRVEQEIKKEIEGNIDNCFSSLKEWYEKRGYSVKESKLNLTIEIVPNKIKAVANNKIEISKEGEVQIFSGFDSYIDSDLYDLLGVVQDIISEEAKFGKFEYMGYSLVNSDYRIRLIEYSDNSIYTIKKMGSNREFKFATRGMVHWRGISNV